MDSARIVVEQAERMTALIRQLLDFARPRALHKPRRSTSPALARRVCELVATIARKAERHARAAAGATTRLAASRPTTVSSRRC